MKIYQQLVNICVCSFLGEVISKVGHLPIPGSVIGMFLLFFALQFRILKIRDVEQVGSFLLGNLSLLFVPAGVGLMVSFHYIQHSWWILLLITVLSTSISIVFIGRLVQWMKRKFETDLVDLEEKK